MTLPKVGKRGFLIGAGALAAATAAAPSVIAPALAVRRSFDFTDPKDNVTAYVKLQSSVADTTVWQWCVGRMDLAVPGKKVLTLVEYESLFRRRVRPRGPNRFEVTSWEGTYYRDPKTRRITNRLFNPYADRDIEPFHFREGPTTFQFTETLPRLVTGRDVLAKGDEPWLLPWTVFGDDVWVTRENSIEAPNPLTPEKWPLESAGPMIRASSMSTHRGKLSELEDSEITTPAADFIYQATSTWLPWMLMGQTPGWAIWRAQGRKLASLDEAPQETIDTIAGLYPALFADEPWADFSLMFMDYAKERRPAPQ